MADAFPQVWPLPEHTGVKHAILRGYLGAWLPKLAWTGKVLFIDGFAGPGVYDGGEPGSPIIALDIALNHKSAAVARCERIFVFVESDPKRFARLEEELSAIDTPENVVVIRINDAFASAIAEILDDVESDGATLAPAFVMIDPFGWTGFPYSLIRRLGRHSRSEVLVTFMYEHINRFIEHPDQAGNWDELFGTSDWIGIEGMTDPAERREFLLSLYADQLRSAGFEFVFPFEMRDDGNRTEYFLIFGTKSLDGLQAMKVAMWKAAPDGSFSFSDYRAAATAEQMQLWQASPDFDELKRQILAEFAGKRVGTEGLREFVLTRTLYLDTHYKKQILTPMEQAGELKVERPPRRTRAYWGTGTVLDFPTV